MRSSFLGCFVLALGLSAGCEGEGDKPWPPLGGAGVGAGGSAGQSGGAGEGGGPAEEDLSELRALDACDVPEPCLESFVQLIEQRTHSYHKETVACLMSALAERRPGRYEHRTDATFSNGSTAARHLFVVAADGTVAYVRDPSQFFSTPGSTEAPMPPDPARRCRLKPASYFEACQASVEAVETPLITSTEDAAAWACTFGDGTSLRPSTLDWFESCEPESPPRCESGSAPSGAVSDGGGLPNDAGAEADASAAP